MLGVRYVGSPVIPPAGGGGGGGRGGDLKMAAEEESQDSLMVLHCKKISVADPDPCLISGLGIDK